jgi:hypothetical protein
MEPTDTRTLRIAIVLGTLTFLTWPALAAPPQLQASLVFSKATYRQDEEIPVRILFTHTGRSGEPLRLPRRLSQVDFEVADADTGQLVRPLTLVRSAFGPVLLMPELTGGRGKTVEGHLELPPGASGAADFELVETRFGSIPPGRYTARLVCTAPGLALACSPASLTVTPPRPEDLEEKKAYVRVLNAPSRQHMYQLASDFLDRYPRSTFTRRVRREFVVTAIKLKAWPAVVRQSRQLRTEAVWRGEREVADIYLGHGLWHAGNVAEAEAILKASTRGEASSLLKRLREGKD